jgi:hypothetical protein
MPISSIIAASVTKIDAKVISTPLNTASPVLPCRKRSSA